MCALCVAGRTGRFGRKGVAIAFVHDKRSWDEMHAIEEDLQREIIRVDTADFDEMEQVRLFLRLRCFFFHNIARVCLRGGN